MRTLIRSLPVLTLSSWLVACGDSAAPPTSTPLGPVDAPSVTPKVMPFAVGLIVVPAAAQMPLGTQINWAAFKVLSDSSRVPVSAAWRTADEGVVSVNAGEGRAIAVGKGQTMVTAKFGGLSATAVVTVPEATNPGTSNALVVDGFSFIEFHYPSAPGRFIYAPQMSAHAASGRTVQILTTTFTIPGLGDAPMFGCGANLAATPKDLFGEVYGSWLLEIDGAGRATGATGSVIVTFVDDTGATGTMNLSGDIVQGSLPTTYTGGTNGGACFHGYGSSG